MKRYLIAVALAVALSGCAGTSTTTPQSRADTVRLAYMPVRALASLCAAGIKPCEDPNVNANVGKAIPLADAAVDEAVKQILANPDQSSIAKWSSYAMSAIDILSKALTAYGVKG